MTSCVPRTAVIARSSLTPGRNTTSCRARWGRAFHSAWDEVAQSLRYVARAPFRPEVEFAMPSPYVPRLGVLREFAAPSLPPGRPLAEAALELMHRIHTGFAYDSASTEIDTPLAQVVPRRTPRVMPRVMQLPA